MWRVRFLHAVDGVDLGDHHVGQGLLIPHATKLKMSGCPKHGCACSTPDLLERENQKEVHMATKPTFSSR